MSGRTLLSTTIAVLALAGCGGGGDEGSDDASGTYKVDVVQTSFPKEQRLAASERFVVAVRNAGDRAIPHLAVTLQGFTTTDLQPGVADPTHPLWVVDDGPAGGTTAYVDTWALGRLEPRETKRFVWRATPVEAGEHRLRWRVDASLTGKAQAVMPDGSAPEGSVVVRVDPAPEPSRVDPSTGDVVRGD